MSEVVSLKSLTVAGNDVPEYVELTLSDGRVIRYRQESR